MKASRGFRRRDELGEPAARAVPMLKSAQVLYLSRTAYSFVDTVGQLILLSSVS